MLRELKVEVKKLMRVVKNIDVSNFLNEEIKTRSIRERLHQKQQPKQKPDKKKSRDNWER
nr:hypothetical protein [uncultured Blautia sp.]